MIAMWLTVAYTELEKINILSHLVITQQYMILFLCASICQNIHVPGGFFLIRQHMVAKAGGRFERCNDPGESDKYEGFYEIVEHVYD